MKKFLSNYKSTIILLVAIIVGAIIRNYIPRKSNYPKTIGRHILKSFTSGNSTTNILNNNHIDNKNENTKEAW